MDLEELVQICGEQHKVISIVGAGGKTGLMYELARQCSKRGQRVLVSTTTHIAEPENHLAVEEEEVLRLWEEGTYAVTGKKASGKKLSMPSDRQLDTLIKKADIVFLEADGSKGLPCKVPAEHEPVIFPKTSLVIGVMGMSCLGKRMSECCFRIEEAQSFFGVRPDTVLSEELAVSILSSASGTRKNVKEREFAVVLNQCDTEEIKRKAERIAAGLKKAGIKKVVLTCLRKRREEDARSI
ncbi:MAG: putative selenium-dependent hydroxylase accessory protein YqeC [Dorea sp.]|nr:putative selenium-dependent hydroxylase accessory protein YqeC [Dorea sp.]